jgi:hypothetical protein
LEHALGWIALAVGAAAGALRFGHYRLVALAMPAGCVLILSGVTALTNSAVCHQMISSDPS